ncbi:MAG: sensor histidine kinase [Lachnospiraceae bacterium]|nr:sensor histidine kinase [Lachnospiraceae bacterium]
MGNERDKRIFFDKNKTGRSLSRTLKLVFLGIIFAVIISFGISVYLITENERRNHAVREAETELASLSDSIKSNINNYSEISRLIMTDHRLTTFLRADADAVDMGMINDARYGIMDILNVKEGVDSVMVFREDLIMVATDRVSYDYDYNVINDEYWKGDIRAAKGRAVISLNSNHIARKKDGSSVISIGRAIYDLYTQKRTGIMFMNIMPDVIDRMLNKLNYDNICVVGYDGTYVAGNREYKRFFNSSSMLSGTSFVTVKDQKGLTLVASSRIEDTPLVLIRVSPYGTEGTPYAIIYVLVILLLIFILGAAVVGAFVSRNITSPVFMLSNAMEKNRRSGELKKIDTEIPYAELNMLKGDYNNMIDHVNELIETLVDQEKTLRRAELRVLQEQIKPHFLYNSLETIGFMALEAGAGNVHEALETLGSFYRNFLSKGGREIRLYREVNIVKDYLALQKLRYGDIIEDEYDIDEDVNDCIVPKLILQPLVENSIYHGIRLKGEKGQIRISARKKDGILHLCVRDTGVGMSKDRIDKILSRDRHDKEKDEESSFGLWGTIERVRIYCNRDDVVAIRSEEGEYTEVEFIIDKAINTENRKETDGSDEQTIQGNDN